MAYTAITVGFALLYPLIIKTELDYFTVCCIILLYGVPGIVLFSLRGKYNAFLEVEGKKYVVTSLAMVTMVISNLLKLIFLMISDNLLLIQATYCVPSIVQVVFIIFYVRKHYRWYRLEGRAGSQCSGPEKLCSDPSDFFLFIFQYRYGYYFLLCVE